MLIATVCWAANIIAVKEALHELRPLVLVQLRILGAALLFAVLFCAWRRRPRVKLNLHQWRVMAALALSGVIFNQLFFIGGVARTSVAHTGLIVALGPVMVLVLACLMRLEALTVLKLLGMLISFAGVGILTTGKSAHGNGGHWQGDLIVLAGSAVFAYYTILVKGVAQRYDALTLNTFTYGIGALLFTPFGARAALQAPWAIRTPVEWALAYMIVFGSVVPYTIYAFAMADLAASRVAAFSYLQPIIATSLGVLLLAEKLTTAVVIGGALILLGVYLTERERGEENVKGEA
jgi:drug/metabolite transporter (DMT)-like permease